MRKIAIIQPQIPQFTNSNIAIKINDANYCINTLPALDLITSERIDILIKCLYCKSIIEKKTEHFSQSYI